MLSIFSFEISVDMLDYMDEVLELQQLGKLNIDARTVEIPCLTCPTWSHFIQDKSKISIYLSLDKYNV